MAESKAPEPFENASKAQSFDRKGGVDDSDNRGRGFDNTEVVAPERGKSRGGTRGGKPNQASTDIGLSAPVTQNLDAEIEKCDGSDIMTQQLLGDLITKPKLTEKLLSKPPFRFLHDVIMEVIRSTGFASGLYTDLECDSANVTDKNQKMTFLEKIIKVVGVQLNTLVEAKPARIVAGLDPQTTNNFLQLLAVAAKHMPDSSKSVRTVLDQFSDGQSAPPELSKPEPVATPAAAPKQVEQPIASESKSSRQVMKFYYIFILLILLRFVFTS